MSTQLATVEKKEIAVVSDETLRNFLFAQNTSISEREQVAFFQIAKAYNLDPFKREIYCVAYGEGDKRQLSIITGYETYIKRAERTGLLNGWKVEFFGRFEKKNVRKEIRKRDGTSFFKDAETVVELERCFARITIHRKDMTIPFEHEVEFCEYTQDNSMWNSKPVTMLKKVAIGQGFRLCFSDELAGIPYLAEEIGRDPVEISHEELPNSPQPSASATAEQAKAAMANEQKKQKREATEADRPDFEDRLKAAGVRIGFETVIEVCVSHGYDDPDKVLPKDFRNVLNAIREIEENANK